MKRVQILRSTGSHLPRYTEGQVADVSDDVAELLCQLGVAELLTTIPAEPLRAIPDNPSIVAAEEKLLEIKERWTEPDAEPPKPKRKAKPKPQTKE